MKCAICDLEIKGILLEPWGMKYAHISCVIAFGHGQIDGKEVEREACAKACEVVGNQPSTLWEEADCWRHAAEICAHDIRERNK